MRPHILDPWIKLEDAFFASKTFSPALSGAGAPYAGAVDGLSLLPGEGRSAPIARMPIRVPQRPWSSPSTFARDHRSIDEAVLARAARDHFADAQLCELIMFMGFMWAGGTFGAVLGLEPGQPAQR